ncbi:MAG: YheT family hydrolase [Nitrospiria bacterium]
MGDHPERDGFTPAWWCRGRHLQTVWRKLFGETPPLPLKRERWETPDDDFLDLDFLDPSSPSSDFDKAPTVLFLHGLEGSSRAKYILGMLRCTHRMEWRGVALNFRSCSGEINRQRRFYHSGETTDLDWVVRRLRTLRPGSPLFIVGVSLGGNVLLKWLGEKGGEADGTIQAAVAISVPYDLGVAARLVDRGVSRIYGLAFLRTLKQKALLKARQYPDLVDPDVVRRIESFAEFDDKVTAPIHGFSSGIDYWTQSSSQKFLSGVRRPTLLIHAKDDPFLPITYLPKREILQSKWLITDIQPTGGHAGFVQGSRPWRATYWAESRAMEFLSSFIEGKGK